MKVLMTADTLGGVFTYTVELVAALRERGAQFAVATFGRPMTPTQRESLRAAGPAAVYESGLALEWMPAPWKDVDASRRWLLELEQREMPDVIHLNAYAPAAAPFSAPVLVVGHSCVLSWWKAVKGERAPASWDRYRQAVEAGIGHADAVAAPSRWMLASLAEQYGPLPARSRAIVNGSSEPELAAHASERDDRLVLAAGRMWDGAKNLQALMRAAEIMGTGATVAVAGDLGDRMVGDVPSRLRLLGYLDRSELREWRRRAAVFVAPARYEPFGLGILEAARAGCALVLGDIPSLRELWDGCALFVAPDDARELASTLDLLLLDPERGRDLGVLAQQRSRRYGAAAMAEDYVSLYEQLAPKRKSLAA